jgi:hypothetical protein
MVYEFMEVMGQMPKMDGAPIDISQLELGLRLVREEVLNEFFPAMDKFKESQTVENATEVLDAICDSIYVLLWVGIAMKLPVHTAFLEVQRSNMAKVQPDGTVKKNEYGKVQKPDGWTPPDLFTLVSDFQLGLKGEKYKNGIRNHD